MTLSSYILSHIDPEPEYLHQLWRATNLHLNYPRMASGHLQGCLLRMLVHMIRPKTVVELGTFTGYSALSMASALEEGAMLHTIERNDEQEDFTRPWLENSPWAEHIRFYIGDALEVIPTLPAPFDLVFIDADKRHYSDYYRAVLPLVRPGGYILADNTLWDGHVFDDEATALHRRIAESDEPLSLNGKDAQTQGIMAFNDLVAQDPAVERVILPLRDGLTIIRRCS
ncbi:MAG: O-methyltransferase [Bacteroidales bacterium]|nr:O-methyltransferase [Bacteroidales bacterium]